MNHARAAKCLVVVMILLSSGCAPATTQMPLDRSPDNLDLQSNSVGIFVLRVSNEFKPKYQPSISTVEVIPDGQQKGTRFAVSPKQQANDEEFNEYLISLDLPPGTHAIGEIAGGAGGFPFAGQFRFPLDTWFELPPQAIVYLGHVTMNNRQRVDGEPRSGSIFPLLDQAFTGFANGTFDVLVTDAAEQDLARFMQDYPILQNYSIQKSIMSQQRPDK